MHFTLSDYLLDVVHNSYQAGADLIEVEVEEDPRTMVVLVRDNGCGMSKQELAQVVDPFATDAAKHPTRRVGLGIPFLAQAMDAVEGEFDIDSTLGRGTIVRFCYDPRHVDAPPVGDLVECFVASLCFDGDYDLAIRRSCRNGLWSASRQELSAVLGDMAELSARSLLRRYLESQELDTCQHLEDTYGKDES